MLSLFKFMVQAELKGYLPDDYVDLNFRFFKARMEILKQYNLNGALLITEPFYLPEEFFLDHPDGCGPRCDHPCRARNAYYSPCIGL
jgi:hypothetical protein